MAPEILLQENEMVDKNKTLYNFEAWHFRFWLFIQIISKFNITVISISKMSAQYIQAHFITALRTDPCFLCLCIFGSRRFELIWDIWCYLTSNLFTILISTMLQKVLQFLFFLYLGRSSFSSVKFIAQVPRAFLKIVDSKTTLK